MNLLRVCVRVCVHACRVDVRDHESLAFVHFASDKHGAALDAAGVSRGAAAAAAALNSSQRTSDDDVESDDGSQAAAVDDDARRSGDAARSSERHARLLLAEHRLRQAVREDPLAVDAWLLLGRVLLASGDALHAADVRVCLARFLLALCISRRDCFFFCRCSVYSRSRASNDRHPCARSRRFNIESIETAEVCCECRLNFIHHCVGACSTTAGMKTFT